MLASFNRFFVIKNTGFHTLSMAYPWLSYGVSTKYLWSIYVGTLKEPFIYKDLERLKTGITCIESREWYAID